MSDEGRHPYFHDGRQVRWHVALDGALALAAAEGKQVLVVYGRPTCGGTRALVEKTIAKEEIAEYMERHFVAVAAHADQAEPAVEALLPSLPRRAPTPLCIYLAPDGRPLHSTAGGRPAAVFLNDMMEAHVKR